MAEFQEVIRQYDRMCKANAGCINCPLHHEDGCSISVFIRYTAEIEQKIMHWAAEHPEPVYPTWGEWLEKQGVAKKVLSPRYEENGASYYELMYEITNPIPADIAQKLGLEPKEG